MDIVFYTDTNLALVRKFLKNGHYREGKFELGYLKDGEIAFKLLENVSGKETMVIGSTFSPGENLIKLVTVINTLKIRGAAEITLVIPFMGYMKSDTEDKPGMPVNAKLFTKFIEEAGVTKVITLDLHSRKNAGYFSVPLTELTAVPLLAKHFLHKVFVAAPDAGGIEMAKRFAKEIKANELIVLNKIRPADEQAEVVKVEGKPAGKKIVLVDDLIQTGGTLIAAAKKLLELGATEINVAATHMDWPAGGAENMAESKLFKEVIITDSFPKPKNIMLPKGFKVLSVSELIYNGVCEA